MNQTRTFLIFAWLMVAALLWMEWGKEKAAPAAPATTTQVAGAPAVPVTTSPGSVPSANQGALPGVPATAPLATVGAAPAAAPAATVTVTTDVLKVVLDGGEMREADLLA